MRGRKKVSNIFPALDSKCRLERSPISLDDIKHCEGDFVNL